LDNGRLPAVRTKRLRDALSGCDVVYLGRASFKDEIERLSCDAERALRILVKILRLPCPCAGGEVKGALHPERAQGHDVWRAVWARRRQPNSMAVWSARRRDLRQPSRDPLKHPLPGDERRAVAIEVARRCRLRFWRRHYASPSDPGAAF